MFTAHKLVKLTLSKIAEIRSRTLPIDFLYYNDNISSHQTGVFF